jgi:hypothetical protein
MSCPIFFVTSQIGAINIKNRQMLSRYDNNSRRILRFLSAVRKSLIATLAGLGLSKNKGSFAGAHRSECASRLPAAYRDRKGIAKECLASVFQQAPDSKFRFKKVMGKAEFAALNAR